MKLHLNSEFISAGRRATVFSLVHDLGIDIRKIAIERNGEIVPRSAYGKTRLTDGDRIEIVHFIGGG